MLADKSRATVDFERMVAVVKNNGITKREIKVRRTENNKRSRPNPEERSGFCKNDFVNDEFNLLNNKDLEWLAWNWRLLHNQNMFQNR